MKKLELRHALTSFKFYKNDGTEIFYENFGEIKLKDFLRLKNEDERVFEIRVEPHASFNDAS